MSTDDLVPPGFDLAAARRAPSTTPRDERPQCPHCGSVKLLPCNRSTRGMAAAHDAAYRCHTCGRPADPGDGGAP